MNIYSRKLHITAICIMAATVLAISAYWSYKRYLSPDISPSMVDYPNRGIDLSAHNGDVDFEAVKRAGMKFVILKASEGVSFTDKKFKDNYTAARKAGLMVGAYHFFRFDCDGGSQAYHFLQTVKGMDFDLPLAIDIEESGNPAGHSHISVTNSLKQAINHLELRGHEVMLYTNKGGYRKYVLPNFPDYPLWICSFSDPPGPSSWYIWQYTHRGTVEGVSGNVDINIIH